MVNDKAMAKETQIGKFQEIGLMYANATYPVLVHLPKLHLMVTALVYWYGT
jgi:hypothetical protein